MTRLHVKQALGLLALFAVVLALGAEAGAAPPKKQYVKEYAIRIVGVVGGSPAEQQGLEVGDIITQVNGFRVRSMADFRNRIGQAGFQADLIVLSQGDPNNEQTVTVYPINGRIGINGDQVLLDDNSGYGGKKKKH
jgi:membrane-associated protease RseP (regulator of RpoE activity)